MLTTLALFLPWNAAQAGTCLLLYMIGGDLETDSGAAAADLLELAHPLPEQIRAFVRIGGAKKFWLPGLTDGHMQDLTLRNGQWTILEDQPKQSMSKSFCLEDFIRRYADDRGHNILILWGHGDGIHSSLGVDQLEDNALLPLSAIEEALSSAGIHFDFIGMDACGMATLEAAWRMRGFADIFAASASTEPLSGWNYSGWPAHLDQSPDEWMSLLLQESNLSLMRTDGSSGLIFVQAAALNTCAEELCTVLDSTTRTGNHQTVGDIIASLQDENISGIDPNIRRLLLPADPASASDLDQIGASYAAWLLRK